MSDTKFVVEWRHKNETDVEKDFELLDPAIELANRLCKAGTYACVSMRVLRRYSEFGTAQYSKRYFNGEQYYQRWDRVMKLHCLSVRRPIRAQIQRV